MDDEWRQLMAVGFKDFINAGGLKEWGLPDGDQIKVTKIEQPQVSNEIQERGFSSEQLKGIMRKIPLIQEIMEGSYEEGLRKGEVEGWKDVRTEVARVMLARGMDIALVSEVTGLSSEEVQSLLAH